MNIWDFYDTSINNILLIILIVLIFTYIVSSFFVSTLKKYFHQTHIIPDDFSFRRFFKPPVWAIFALIVFKLILPSLNIAAEYRPLIGKIWLITTISVTIFFLIKVTTFLRMVVFQNFDVHQTEEFRYRKLRTQLHFIEKFIIVCLCFIGLAAIFMSFDEVKKVGGSLMASAGVAGIILGIAAQKSLGNLIAGFQIAFTQPFKLNDTVVVDGEWGIIKEITLTYIVVKSWDKRNLIVPITHMLEKPFQNWTRSNEKSMAVILLYADYSLPFDKIKEEFERLISESPRWDGETGIIYINEFTERTMQLKAMVSAKNIDDAFYLKIELREQLIKYIQENYPCSLPRYRVDSCGNDSAECSVENTLS